MYPDRAMFERMVQDEQSLSGAGRQTLLALFEGPLHLRQILDIVNAHGGEGGGKKITESALRKRLDVLITGGILARAGSERTNPYYYIRRPWIFNQYILLRCRDRPGEGLLDLTILLHELSQMAAGGDAALPHPRYITAVGERTERSHQITHAYESFKKLLGNRQAIGEYLEGIYEDIYEGKVPASDIDGLVARDFLRFVATAPDEEREVRFFLWFAGFFHTLDRYTEALDAFRRGVALAQEQGLVIPAILAGSRISEGQILLHLNDIAAAKEAFLAGSRTRDIAPYVKARYLSGAGEAELIAGDTAAACAPAKFLQALELCLKADPAGTDSDVQELRGDCLRRLGTTARMTGNLEEAGRRYAEAEIVYANGIPRGMVWLRLEQAELLRARAFAAPAGTADSLLDASASAFDEAKAASQKIRNISWFAHGLVGECELARIARQRSGKPLPVNIDTKYANAFEIYCQISSRWGIVQTFVSQALLYHGSAEEYPDKYAVTAEKLSQAEKFSKELGLKQELDLIRRIKSRADPALELHPLTFL